MRISDWSSDVCSSDLDGSVLRVFLQAVAGQRMRPEDVAALQLRNGQGQMVPFSAFSRMRWVTGPHQLERYNGFPAVTVSGEASPGNSSGAALQAMENIADDTLGPGLSYEWTGTAFEETQAGNQV